MTFLEIGFVLHINRLSCLVFSWKQRAEDGAVGDNLQPPIFSAGAYYPNITVQPIMYGRCHLWQKTENRLSRHSHVVDVGLGRCGFIYRLPTGAFGACGHGVSPGAHSFGCVARILSMASFNQSGGFSFSSIP